MIWMIATGCGGSTEALDPVPPCGESGWYDEGALQLLGDAERASEEWDLARADALVDEAAPRMERMLGCWWRGGNGEATTRDDWDTVRHELSLRHRHWIGGRWSHVDPTWPEMELGPLQQTRWRWHDHEPLDPEVHLDPVDGGPALHVGCLGTRLRVLLDSGVMQEARFGAEPPLRSPRDDLSVFADALAAHAGREATITTTTGEIHFDLGPSDRALVFVRDRCGR